MYYNTGKNFLFDCPRLIKFLHCGEMIAPLHLGKVAMAVVFMKINGIPPNLRYTVQYHIGLHSNYDQRYLLHQKEWEIYELSVISESPDICR